MVVCVYLRLSCANQSEPTHHKQSHSSRVQPPDVGGWKRWKRDSRLWLITISGSSHTCTRSCATHARVMDWTTVWEASSSMFSCDTSLPRTFIANRCGWHHFLFFFSAMLFNCHCSLMRAAAIICICWSSQLIIRSRKRLSVDPGVDQCCRPAAVTGNVWRGRQETVAGKNLSVWTHQEASVSPPPTSLPSWL